MVHKRYLDYRETHVYFGGKKAMLTAVEFTEADLAYRLLEEKGDARDDEEEARFLELAKALFRD
jgi:hypothetical protein